MPSEPEYNYRCGSEFDLAMADGTMSIRFARYIMGYKTSSKRV